MERVIAKNNFQITVKEKGAELVSATIDNEEFIWNKQEIWAKSSPILFPFVGQILDSKYIYMNKEYHFDTRHGFARDMNFEISKINDTTLICELKYNEKTLKKYPFKFSFKVIYQIIGENSLKMKFIVNNLDDKIMYFSLGSHPAFALSDNYEDYYIKLDKKVNLEYYELIEQKYPGKKISLGTNDKIEILDKLFENDAIIFDGNISDKSIICNKNSNKSVEIIHKNYPYLAYWRPVKAPFICVESWYGITDLKEHNYLLQDKKGIQKLEVGKQFECELIFTFNK